MPLSCIITHMWLLDNLFPKVLYEGNSKYNKDIKVIKIGKTLKLISGGVTQSFNKDSKFAKKKIWGEVVKTILKHKKNPEKILLLGMGAGTMLHFLKRSIPNENLHITSVEIDEEIINLSKKYFDLDEIKNHKIIISDAKDVVENPKKYDLNFSFDCVIVDTYQGHNISGSLDDKNFMENLFNKINSECLVLFNISILKKEKKMLSDYLRKAVNYLNPIKYKAVNYKAYSDNYLIYGYKQENNFKA